jgi:hypothetical protein
MRCVDEYRNEKDARVLVEAIQRRATRPWTIMEICGGQTRTLIKFGIDRMLKDQVSMVHGPGCPVCVTPPGSHRPRRAHRLDAGRHHDVVRRHAARPGLGACPGHGDDPDTLLASSPSPDPRN